MSDSLIIKKTDAPSLKEESPLFHISYVQTWENYHRMNVELNRPRIWRVSTSYFVFSVIAGTVFMGFGIEVFGWICYGAALLLLFGIPLIWEHNLHTQFMSAKTDHNKEWNYSFYENSFEVNTEDLTATRKYTDLYQVIEGKTYIYLFPEKNRPIAVPRDYGKLDKYLLGLNKKQESYRISPILTWLFLIGGVLLAFFGITEERLPNRWLLQTWAYILCEIAPLFWQITVITAIVILNRYRISGVRRPVGRIILRILSVLLCGFLIFCLGFGEFIFLLNSHSVTRNDNGTYTQYVNDGYSPEEYYLYQPSGPFYLKYLRPMSDSGDTDPSVSEEEWLKNINRNKKSDTEPEAIESESEESVSTKTESESLDHGHNSDSSEKSDLYAKEEQVRNGALKIFDEYFSSDGATFQENYTAKGNVYFVLNESDSDITYLQYDRDSQNEKCGLYVLYKVVKSSDGSWSSGDAQILNTYAFEYSTGTIAESGKTNWSDTGNEEYQKLTGEP